MPFDAALHMINIIKLTLFCTLAYLTWETKFDSFADDKELN